MALVVVDRPGAGHRARSAGRILLAAVALVLTASISSLVGESRNGLAPRADPLAVQRLLTAPRGDRFGVGELSLDDPIADAIAVFGAPDDTSPDIFGQSHTWRVGALELAISEFGSDARISGLTVVVHQGTGARPRMAGGVTVGQTTLAEVLRAWGTPSSVALSPLDDFVVEYDSCRNGAPVLVKFDQRGLARGPGVPLATSHFVDKVLLAYADAPPGDCV